MILINEFWWFWSVGFDGFDKWVLIRLMVVGILMGGFMMEASLMIVVVWVDDGGLGIDRWWWLGIDQVDGGWVYNILLNKCVE